MSRSSHAHARVSVTFSADAMAWLEAEAGRRATTVADLIRRLGDETRGSYIVPPFKPSTPP
jgi:hypothetical protein